MSIEIKKALKKIRKKIDNSTKTCMIPGCKLPSINSHILQKNGIISSISRDRYVYELTETDIFKVQSHQLGYEARLIGINKAFSFPLFCNPHDTNVFKTIEVDNPDFHNYISFILLSYRALCTEIRRKLDSKKENELILADPVIKPIISEDHKNLITVFLDGCNRGIKHLEALKDLLEIEKTLGNQERFYFQVYEYELIPICVYALFTPGEPQQIASKPIGELPTIFIHILPFNSRSFILVGCLRTHLNQIIKEYIESWKNLNKEQLNKMANDLIVARVETWCCSPDAFEKIPPETLIKYKKYVKHNAFNHSIEQNINFNLFSDI